MHLSSSARGKLVRAPMSSLAILTALVCVVGSATAQQSAREHGWAAAPKGGTHLPARSGRMWAATGAAQPARTRTQLVPTSYPAGFPATAPGATSYSWRVYDLAQAVSRLSGVGGREEALARWVTEMIRSRFPDARVTAIVDGTKLIARAPAAIHPEIARLAEQLNQPGPDTYAHLTIAEAVDPNWRRVLVRDLPPGVRGPAGQALWLLSTAKGNVLRAEIAAQRRPVPDLVAGTYRLKHGVPAVFDYTLPVPYTAAIQPSDQPGLDPYQPVLDRVEQRLRVVLLPVWQADHSAVDLYLGVELCSVERLRTVNTTLQVPGGTQPITVHVPETSTMDWSIATSWRPGRTLVVSLGIHPSLQTAPPTGAIGALTRPSGELLIIGNIRPATETAGRGRAPFGGWRRR